MDIVSWYLGGVAVIPVKGDKTPAVSSWRKYQHTMPSAVQVAAWSTHYPAYGIILGWQGLLVLDFDDVDLYLKWLASPLSEGFRSTYQVLTSRGVHVYLQSARPIHTTHLVGVDLLGRGAYVLGEGSLHPSGVSYLGNDAPIVQVADMNRVALDVLSLTTPKQRAPFLHTKPVTPCASLPSIKRDPWASAGLTMEERIRIAKTIPAWEVLGATLQASGANKDYGLCCCPLHDDQHPSMSCDLRTGRVYCFAGCTPHGMDAINAYQWRYGVPFLEAVLALSEW